MPLPILPYVQLSSFLPSEDLAFLLDWTIENEARFSEATIRSADASVVNPDWRIALTCRDLGPLEALLQTRFLAALPTLIAETGVVGPEPRKLELEIAAHGDGAHYRAHTDIPIGPRRSLRSDQDDRVLSAVLYFHAEPKRFEGGELRLYRLGADETSSPATSDAFVDVEPVQNSLVAFHSWVRHEVRRVTCPSKAFRDYRFAVNCWYRRKLGDPRESGGEA